MCVIFDSKIIHTNAKLCLPRFVPPHSSCSNYWGVSVWLKFLFKIAICKYYGILKPIHAFFDPYICVCVHLRHLVPQVVSRHNIFWQVFILHLHEFYALHRRCQEEVINVGGTEACTFFVSEMMLFIKVFIKVLSSSMFEAGDTVSSGQFSRPPPIMILILYFSVFSVLEMNLTVFVPVTLPLPFSKRPHSLLKLTFHVALSLLPKSESMVSLRLSDRNMCASCCFTFDHSGYLWLIKLSNRLLIGIDRLC